MKINEALISVWRQVLVEGRAVVELDGEQFPTNMFRAKKLRGLEFNFGGSRFIGIEQNPRTTSRWAALAREGKRIMQFRCEGRYVANVCDGKLLRYPVWKTLGLEE